MEYEALVDKIFRYMKSIIEEPYTVDIKLSLIGIRQLAQATSSAKL